MSADIPLQFLKSNEEWAKAMATNNPGFLPGSAENPQEPKILWLGCGDSRVPESVITNSLPGQIFVHRNIANQVPLTDDNSMAVVSYAVGHLNVDHVIVAGHTGCGGAKASYAAAKQGPPKEPTNSLERWLAPLVKLVGDIGADKETEDVAVPRIIEANVKKHVEALASLDVIAKAGRKVQVHGWIYDLKTGLIADLKVTQPA